MARRFAVPLLVWAGWTGIALLFTLYVMLPSPAAGDPAEWGRAAGWQLVTWWSWAACTPLVVLLARRLVSLAPPYALIASHVAAGLVVSLLCTALQGALQWLAFSGVRMRYDIAGPSSLPMADQWSFNLVVYAMVVGVFYVWRAGRLESQLARARLDALSARLRPHCLFNTLNTISTLVLEDPGSANRMIGRLSELLRQAFDRGDGSDVALDEELVLLGHYLAIQEQRFGDRVRVTLDLDPGLGRAMVPPLLLQPLVENAITHGLAGRPGDGAVAVQVLGRRSHDRLRLVVRDDGPGFGAEAARAGGVGLAATRARLSARHGAGFTLVATNAPEGGAVVTIEIPFVADARADR